MLTLTWFKQVKMTVHTTNLKEILAAVVRLSQFMCMTIWYTAVMLIYWNKWVNIG
jgi:hypothetical protein